MQYDFSRSLLQGAMQEGGLCVHRWGTAAVLIQTSYVKYICRFRIALWRWGQVDPGTAASSQCIIRQEHVQQGNLGTIEDLVNNKKLPASCEASWRFPRRVVMKLWFDFMMQGNLTLVLDSRLFPEIVWKSNERTLARNLNDRGSSKEFNQGPESEVSQVCARHDATTSGLVRSAIIGSWRQGKAVAGLAKSHGDRLQHQIHASGNGRSAWLARLHPNPCCMYLVLRPVLPLKMHCLCSKAQRWYKEWRKDGKRWCSPEKELSPQKKGFPKWRPVLETADSPTGKKAQKLPNTDIHGHCQNRPKHEQKGGAMLNFSSKHPNIAPPCQNPRKIFQRKPIEIADTLTRENKLHNDVMTIPLREIIWM